MDGQIIVVRERQDDLLADEVSAIMAVVGPILKGVLYGLKQDVVAEVGGHSRITLHMLARLRRPGDGDAGISFEYAVHDALLRGDPLVAERVEDALRLSRIPGTDISSILLGVEKSGALNLIDTAKELLTDESVLLTGMPGRPVKLLRHMDSLVVDPHELPSSISGLWKADLFIGRRDADRWVAASVKINATQLAPAPGLRLGIVPATRRMNEVRLDERRNLVVVPLLYDGGFMEVFYRAWHIVVKFLNADARVPAPVDLPDPASRLVARELEERRSFAVVDVIRALRDLAQPGLVRPDQTPVGTVQVRPGATNSPVIIAPIARQR